MIVPDLPAVTWRKSTYSNGSGNCVEMATIENTVAVRDSKNPNGAALAFSAQEWADFLSGARAGRFDLP